MPPSDTAEGSHNNTSPGATRGRKDNDMDKRYYLAYGSNLNVPQMRKRCPNATILGTAMLENWELLYRGSMTGSYLTLQWKEGGRVPVAVWEVSKSDEVQLDKYEGFPRFYYKKDLNISCKGIRTHRRYKINAFAYIMHEDRPIGIPAQWYIETCKEGYDTFYFDKRFLDEALERSSR